MYIYIELPVTYIIIVHRTRYVVRLSTRIIQKKKRKHCGRVLPLCRRFEKKTLSAFRFLLSRRVASRDSRAYRTRRRIFEYNVTYEYARLYHEEGNAQA